LAPLTVIRPPQIAPQNRRRSLSSLSLVVAKV
jgi:hypothetical protein